MCCIVQHRNVECQGWLEKSQRSFKESQTIGSWAELCSSQIHLVWLPIKNVFERTCILEKHVLCGLLLWPTSLSCGLCHLLNSLPFQAMCPPLWFSAGETKALKVICPRSVAGQQVQEQKPESLDSEFAFFLLIPNVSLWRSCLDLRTTVSFK